jgi:hypothetical protein
VSVTDPSGTGVPLFFPDLSWWNTIRIATSGMTPDTNVTGLAFDLQPRSPSERWVREVRGSTSHSFLTGQKPAATPAITRLDGSDEAAVMASGPLIRERLGAVLAATFSRASEFHRAEATPVNGHTASFFSHLVLTPNSRDQLRTIALVQRVTYPLEQRTLFRQPQSDTADTSSHVQAVWARQRTSGPEVRVFGSYTRRQRTPDYDPRSGAVLERLVDGPIGQLAFVSDQTTSFWSVGASTSPPERALVGRAHAISAGATITGGRSSSSTFFSGSAGELIDGTAGRLWVFQNPTIPSSRHQRVLAAWVGDRIDPSPRLRLEGSLRLESATGSADRALEGIAWRSWLPRANVRWRMGGAWNVVAFGGYARTTDLLALNYLAIGDPGAPTADVYRWPIAPGAPLSFSARGPLVARAGPGIAGDPAFSAIDSNLNPPVSDEFAVGVEMYPISKLRVRITGVTRRVRDLLALVNFGAPASTAYSLFTVQDPGSDVLSPNDDRFVPVYDRFAESFGRDRYVLTNQTTYGATYEALEISLRLHTSRFDFFGGGTAGLAEGPAANRGFGPLENDQPIVGELWSDPNAATFAKGRLFTDRAFTGKLAAIARLPSDVRLGLIARYQDGQPFARVLVLTLNQGVDAVRAFANGDSRFLFVGTLDARLQKRIRFGAKALDIIFDGYNLLNLSNGVEENAAAGPNVRTSTVIQPPRSLHVGARLTF